MSNNRGGALTRGRSGPIVPFVLYPASTSDDTIFSGHPNLIALENLFQLNKRLSIGQIVAKILEKHPNSGVHATMLSNRLARAITHIAARDGRARNAVRAELEAAQKANGTLAGNHRRPKAQAEGDGDDEEEGEEDDEDDDENATIEQLDGGAAIRDDGPSSTFVKMAAEQQMVKEKEEKSKKKEENGEEETSTSNEVKPFDGTPVHDGNFRSW